jgi:hypothetical protein
MLLKTNLMSRSLKSKYFLLSFITIFCLSLVQQSVWNEAYAVSPSFVRQAITDPARDWALLTFTNDTVPVRTHDGSIMDVPLARNLSECLSFGSYPVPDIRAVSFISDSNKLNSTIWLSGLFREPPVNDTLDTFRERLRIIAVNLTNYTTLDQFTNQTLG